MTGRGDRRRMGEAYLRARLFCIEHEHPPPGTAQNKRRRGAGSSRPDDGRVVANLFRFFGTHERRVLKSSARTLLHTTGRPGHPVPAR